MEVEKLKAELRNKKNAPRDIEFSESDNSSSESQYDSENESVIGTELMP